MKNSQLKDEFEKVNESSGTSPHRYGKEAFEKGKKGKCNTNLFWIGGAVVALIVWKYCRANPSKNNLLTFLACDDRDGLTDRFKHH